MSKTCLRASASQSPPRRVVDLGVWELGSDIGLSLRSLMWIVISRHGEKKVYCLLGTHAASVSGPSNYRCWVKQQNLVAFHKLSETSPKGYM